MDSYWEPPCEDDESEAEVRKRRAEAAAVDFTWLSRESHKASVVRVLSFLFHTLTDHKIGSTQRTEKGPSR